MGLVLGSKPDVITAVILVALIAASWAPRTVGPLGFRWDGAVYYVLGTSLAEGKGSFQRSTPGWIGSAAGLDPTTW